MRAILTYHSIDPSESVISMSREAFRRHVEWLASDSVRVVSLSELVEFGQGEDAVALTFDDGFESFLGVAAPLLAEHGIPATVFVVTERVGGSNDWEANGPLPELSLMDWDQLGRAVEMGFEIGAHTRSHPRLTSLPMEALRDEIAGSGEDIERELGVRPTSFAYPFGAYDGTVEEMAKREYSSICTADLGVVAESRASRLPRLDTYYYRNADFLEAWGNPAFHLRLRARRMGRRFRHFARTVVGS